MTTTKLAVSLAAPYSASSLSCRFLLQVQKFKLFHFRVAWGMEGTVRMIPIPFLLGEG